MIEFKTIIKKFGSQGEKTGWTIIEIPSEIAILLQPGRKTSFRVKGYLDKFPVHKMALVPIGGGDFIMALNASVRKKIGKHKGDKLFVKLEADMDPEEYNEALMECLKDDQDAKSYFMELTPGHKRYFSNWIESAKTENTRINRIAKTLNALSKRWDYGMMLRAAKNS